METDSRRTLFHGAQYKGIADTIVQLIRRSTSGVIVPSQPNRSEERRLEKRAWPQRSPVRKKTMSIIDKALEANRNYAKSYDPTLGRRPTPKIAVVTCMDPRLSDLSGILGLPQADIDVIRTGGPAVTEDVLAELIVSNRVLGTTEILLLNHTGCGFTTFTDDEMNAKLRASTGDASPAPMRFFSYKDPEENTREQIRKVRSHPWIAKEVPVRGFIFDVDTGRLSEVKALEEERAA
jgi:carbonic anhydrase